MKTLTGNPFSLSGFIYLIFFLHTGIVSGQSGLQKEKWQLNSEATGWAGSVAFWLRANRFGVMPAGGRAGSTLKLHLAKDYSRPDSLKKARPGWGFSVQPVWVSPQGAPATLLLPEAHVKVRYGRVELYAGRRMDLMGLGDTLLTSGFYAVSGNAMPVPKIQLATTGFVPLKILRSHVAVNAGIAHGWYNVDYLEGARLHQKYLYFRLGRASFKGYAGLNHQAQWAGHAEYLKDRPDLAVNGSFASSWKDFHYVLLAYTPRNWQNKGLPSMDGYRVGNHLGSHDLAVEGKLPGGKFFLYHQHIYEDVSGTVWKNFPDGLWGISWSPGPAPHSTGIHIEKITLEHLTTLSQSGELFYQPGSRYQGGDNYFNHGQYHKGWSYKEKGMGTPFITPRHEMKDPPPETTYFPNNRVSMWHLGLKVKYQRTSVLLLASRSLNHGRYGEGRFNPVRKQLSAGLNIQTLLEKNWALVFRLGADSGDLLTNTTGGQLGIQKKWL